ncbi:MAG: hypothetical protein IKZ88_08925 [Neisseriaceae bacterium]|nr:hypothetical protein [Neisseriaceae bacterium]
MDYRSVNGGKCRTHCQTVFSRYKLLSTNLSGCLKSFLPLRWVENPPYNQAYGLAVGWEAHPTAFRNDSSDTKD